MPFITGIMKNLTGSHFKDLAEKLKVKKCSVCSDDESVDAVSVKMLCLVQVNDGAILGHTDL